MKLLYISHSSSPSGWGAASKSYLKALSSQNVDVVAREVKLNNASDDIPDWLRELQSKPVEGCDIVIQHLLPHHYLYCGEFKKNIGIVSLETHNIKYSSWPSYLNLMDEIVVPCQYNKTLLKEIGFKKPVHIVPHAVDLSIYDKDYPNFDFGQFNDDFKFIFCGDWVMRKNIASLLKAYHLEFHLSEPVSIILKVSKFGKSPEEMRRVVDKFCEEVKRGLRLYPDISLYKPELIITNYLPQEQLMGLYQSCDCGVFPSRGEAFSWCTVDLLGLGKPVVVTQDGAFLDYIEHSVNGLFVSNYQQPVFGEHDTFSNYFSGRETWSDVSVPHLRYMMRIMYEERDRFKPENCKSSIEKFSYGNVSNQFKRILDN